MTTAHVARDGRHSACSTAEKIGKPPLLGRVCLLTTGDLIRVRCGAGLEERLMGSFTQEARTYGQSRGVIPFSCAYLAATASTSGRTSA
jgi:hypothetical protein